MVTGKAVMNQTREKAKAGFSLIELSVLISVAATIAVGYLSWNQSVSTTNAQKSIETRNEIVEIIQAIEAFRVRKGRLPCPADPRMRENNTYPDSETDLFRNDFGKEDLESSSDYTSVNVAGTLSIKTLGTDCPFTVGTVPVHSLELDKSYMFDSWDNRYTYQVSKNLCGSDKGVDAIATQTSLTPTSEEVINRSISRGCSSIDYANRTGNITVLDEQGGILTQNAAFVLVSHGSNGTGAYMPSGERKSFTPPSGCSPPYTATDRVCFEWLNYNGHEASYTGTVAAPVYNINTTFMKASLADDFDDLVLFKTRIQLERLSMNREKKLIKIPDCNANSAAIANLSTADLEGLNTGLTELQAGGSNTGEQVTLGILLSVQNACISYYTDCNGGGPCEWDGPECPLVGSYDYHDPSDSSTIAGGCSY